MSTNIKKSTLKKGNGKAATKTNHQPTTSSLYAGKETRLNVVQLYRKR